MMQQEILEQGATLAKLQPQHQQQQQQQQHQQQQQQHQQQHQQQQRPAVHAALALSSASFPVEAASSELSAHPGDVLQVS
jgi:hypothetical protein